MNKFLHTLREKIPLGYSFADDREASLLVFVNYFITAIFLGVVLIIYLIEDELLPATYRYHTVVLLGILNLWFLRNKWVNLVRIILLITLPAFILILPPQGGVHSDEFYFWFQYIPIGLSIIPHFILHPIKHRFALLLTLVLYMLLGIFISDYLILTSDGSESIIPIVQANHLYYRIIPVILFFFINGTLRLLFVRNHNYREIMKSQQEELMHAEKMSSLGILTSGLAHEINNPLNFISGSLNALESVKHNYLNLDDKNENEKKALAEQFKNITDKAYEGIRRATDIITRLEFFANPDVKQDKQDTPAELLIDNCLRAVDAAIPDYLSIEKKVPSNLVIRGNEHRLRLVLTHILRNAVDAIEAEKNKDRARIIIEAARENRSRKPYTRISVLNSGPSIPEKNLKHLFDPFFSSRDPGAGMGLGLSISYMIIKEHGGVLEVSNEDEMVRFDAYLPAWTETEDKA